jgi:hypothetical protein
LIAESSDPDAKFPSFRQIIDVIMSEWAFGISISELPNGSHILMFLSEEALAKKPFDISIRR